MAKRLNFFAGALLAGSALVACAENESFGASSPGSTDTTTAEPEIATLTVDTVRAAHSKLAELAGAPLDSIQVQSMLISANGNLSVDALDPAEPTELNQYVAYPDGRTDVRPYDYGGAERYDALLSTMFDADLVSAEAIANSWENSFNRVEGDPAALTASGATIERDTSTREIEISIVNGTERDRQTVYYDQTGNFLRVS